MRSSLYIGRFGPLSLSLNYTWLFISVLGLWGLAFLWLPDNFPQWSSGIYWLVAVLVMGLYLASLIVRELVRAAVAGFDRRGIILYPFGAATPYRLDEIGAWRTLVSMFAALVFNLGLGGLLLLIADRVPSTGGPGEFAQALLIPLGFINLWIGLINLIPGIPFDGGRALTNMLYWFSGQREQGLGFTRTVGEITSLGLVVAGAWIGLTSQNWLTALVLVVLGWGAREADEKGKQLGILRTGLSGITARDIMEAADPKDSVSADASVAKMVLSHPYYASDKPMAVVKNGNGSSNGTWQGEESIAGTESGEMVGVITLSKADDLLQGTWPTTPVTSLMEAPAEVESFAPNTPLTEVLERIEERGSSPDEQQVVPVIGNGKLLGSIDPSRLAAFEQAELELGAAEAPVPDDGPGLLARLKTIVPAVAVLAALAILGNIAINSDPYSFRNTRRAALDLPITFTQTVPLAGSLATPNADGVFLISAVAVGAQPVTSASLTLDGVALPVELSGPNPLQQSINATSGELKDGQHALGLVVADRLGRIARTDWQFWVGEVGTPTPGPGPETVQIVKRQPAVGGLVLAGSRTTIGLVVSWGQPVSKAHLTIDGSEVAVNVEQLPNVADRYYLSTPAAGFDVGSHTVVASIAGDTGGVYATDWTFFAAIPDEQNVYFKETGYFVSRDFYDYWNRHGGVDIFGYPVSDRIRETDPDSGEAYIAQYFQRARFEMHPSLGNKILLGRLGTLVHAPDAPTAAAPGATFFPETGHNVAGQFLDFWQSRGGLELFGYPISEVRAETSPLDGKEYQVQYFERFKFELHPELAGTPYEVQLAQLGTLVYGGK